MFSQRPDRVKVAGFRSIAQLDLHLRPINILIGPNGAGKSNFLEVFTLVQQLATGHLQEYVHWHGGANRLLHNGQGRTPRLELEFHFLPHGYRLSLGATAADTFALEQEGGLFKTGQNNPSPFFESLTAPGATESDLATPATRPRGPVAQYAYDTLQSWRVYHFRDTRPAAPVKQSHPLGDPVLREDAGNLAALLWRLRHAELPVYQRLVRTIQRVIPFFQDFYFAGPYDAGQSIGLHWRDPRNPDLIFSAHDLSDGSLRFICLATLLLQAPGPGVVLLDEPELGLHPFALQVLAGLLRRAAAHATIIVATQSPTFINEFNPADLVVVDRNAAGESTFTRPDEAVLTPWLARYPLGELWQKNVFGGHP